jgi:hypothetical protein
LPTGQALSPRSFLPIRPGIAPTIPQEVQTIVSHPTIMRLMP